MGIFVLIYIFLDCLQETPKTYTYICKIYVKKWDSFLDAYHMLTSEEIAKDQVYYSRHSN